MISIACYKDVRPRLRLALLCAIFLGLLAGPTAWGEGVIRLSQARRVILSKAKGRVDQVVPLPSGGFLVRDADLLNPASQALEVYDAAGRFVRKISGYGPRPGSYQALKGIALSSDGTIWVADLLGRLSFFDLNGRLLGTKLIQAPGFQVDGISLDEPHGLFYLSGCLPTHTYLNFGCKVVHQYSFKDRKFLRSFLDNDRQIGEKNLLAVSDNALDVDAQGAVWSVDAPVLRLARVDTRSGKTEAFPVRSLVAKPAPKIEPGAAAEAVYRSLYLLDRVVAASGFTVVSVRGPKGSKPLLEVFDSKGKQVAVDLEPPGTLVGRSRDGRLLFATPVKGGFEIGEYSLSEGEAEKARSGR